MHILFLIRNNLIYINRSGHDRMVVGLQLPVQSVPITTKVVSSNRHDITEILLKVALNTINLNQVYINLRTRMNDLTKLLKKIKWKYYKTGLKIPKG